LRANFKSEFEVEDGGRSEFGWRSEYRDRVAIELGSGLGFSLLRIRCSGFGMGSRISRQSLMIFVQELAETFDFLLTLLRMMMIAD
jgi:hypothetical protein